MYYLKVDSYGIIGEFEEKPTNEECYEVFNDFVNNQFYYWLENEEEEEVEIDEN